MTLDGNVIFIGMDLSAHGDTTVVFERDPDGTIRVISERHREPGEKIWRARHDSNVRPAD